MRALLRRPGLTTLGTVIALAGAASAQFRQEPGKSIGKITTHGDLVVMKLNDGALGKANLFDLGRRTLRFTPEGAGFRVENRALEWDSEFGEQLSGAEVALHKFKFPFSGSKWDSFSVGVTGSIRFGAPPQGDRGGVAPEPVSGGVSIGRFDQLQDAARNLVNTAPAICVFFKPRMRGQRFVKEMDDRVVITWSVSEPAGNIQDFTWTPTVNRFQAVLRRDGTIGMSYEDLAAKDAIVGVYPLVSGGAEKPIATIAGASRLTLSAVDGLFLKATIDRPLPAGSALRIVFRGKGGEAVWSVRPGRGGRAMAFGPGISPNVEAGENATTVRGTLPPQLHPGERLSVRAGFQPPGSDTLSTVAEGAATLSGMNRAEVHFSALQPGDGPYPLVYESFHYLSLPNPRDLSCTVIKALGDRFDFLAYYSDFRVDTPEAGTPSNGPMGGRVTGIGQTERGLASYCSEGRFQWGFVQPVYVGSNQMQEQPPEGVTDTNPRNIAAYKKQLGEQSPDGRMLPYNYAMSQIGHEMGHRWSAFVSAKVAGETIELGPTHWARGLQAPVAFPYQRPTEASAMGGGVWQDNFDGTFTQLDDDYYVPATGWSYLDLYLMGLIAPSDVPDFFILRNLTPAGRDRNGHPIFKADRTRVTIQDVIAAEGPRTPDVYHSQRRFNTGIVVIVEHGKKPSKELIDRANGIRERWMDYFSVTTGRRANMTATPK